MNRTAWMIAAGLALGAAGAASAVELDPNYAEPYYTLGRAYTRAGDEEGARKAFETHRRLSVTGF